MAASPAFVGADPDAVLAELHACYPAQLREDIEAMRRALEQASARPAERRRHIARVFEIAHATKGQAGTFGFNRWSPPSRTGCVCSCGARRAARGGGEEAVLWRHLDALVLLAHHDIRGEAGATSANACSPISTNSRPVIMRRHRRLRTPPDERAVFQEMDRLAKKPPDPPRSRCGSPGPSGSRSCREVLVRSTAMVPSWGPGSPDHRAEVGGRV